MSEDDPLVQSELEGLRAAWRLHADTGMTEAFDELPGTGAGYESLVNSLCTFLSFDAREKMGLLEMDSVLDRGRRLRQVLEWMRPGGPHGREPFTGN
jgi:hypothetical protein